MIPETDENHITELKCVSPRIDQWIRRIKSPEAGNFFHKRLQQLATAAEQKVLSLKSDEKFLAKTD